jgi:predicted signal transduction protein with EAL and GGDEF domain
VRVAEDTGLIKQLTDLMLHKGISTLREIHDRGYHLGLSVNLSTHDLLDRRLADRVQQHLTLNDVDPSMLTLEITESSLLIDAPRARATINELHEVGVSLSIDDFGTGYSSLSYLRRLPVGELKIDQSFVANVLLDEQDEVIVRSTIDLGHNLGLVVVAEGVENNEVLERLRRSAATSPRATASRVRWLPPTSSPGSQRPGTPAGSRPARLLPLGRCRPRADHPHAGSRPRLRGPGEPCHRGRRRRSGRRRIGPFGPAGAPGTPVILET